MDLQDLGANFSSNAKRLLPKVALPAGTTGQLAALTLPVQQLNTTLSSAYQRDSGVFDTLGANLGTAKNQYQNSDE
ncbi:hypothetical protein K7711_25905 [Nocardia sp. CA2R105]|uniref:hypothetical protein n=1 Tax=Nocardia coffeae TaxID=2873381 RepID=UPI001CA6CC55|nr:hypothetical protein [Nocardia coffeae]MBY8859930.1 hypothetical protein [Nocardia coffeae]